ncbi:MAG: hypothetical protein M1838_000705 [Thelocarpon superellum]|nr:MAG: hypothetical protein M1838_000705 [Thelocarpon superellum]
MHLLPVALGALLGLIEVGMADISWRFPQPRDASFTIMVSTPGHLDVNLRPIYVDRNDHGLYVAPIGQPPTNFRIAMNPKNQYATGDCLVALGSNSRNSYPYVAADETGALYVTQFGSSEYVEYGGWVHTPAGNRMFGNLSHGETQAEGGFLACPNATKESPYKTYKIYQDWTSKDLGDFWYKDVVPTGDVDDCVKFQGLTADDTPFHMSGLASLGFHGEDS